MVFSSLQFLFLFLPIVLVIYFLLKDRFRNAFLLFASFIFYIGGSKNLHILLISIGINYICALIIQSVCMKISKRIWLSIAVALNLFLLFIYKYLDFSIQIIDSLFGDLFQPLGIELPLGISFFTFQAISYVVDVYRGEEALKNPIDAGLYISFFPQLIAGPIVRYKTVAKELKDRKITWWEFCVGTKRFAIGLFKKVLLANNLSAVADTAFHYDYSELSVAFAWVGALAFTFQIYFDFSGYSDMAIGLGRMFGFHFDENFNYPYIAKSITEFWRRWHISLGQWFRDYVYIPLGGSRAGCIGTIFNLFIVWLLTGIWHGASYHFVAWGLFYFILLVIEKYIIRPIGLKGVQVVLYSGVTKVCVVIGWVLFYAESLHTAIGYIKAMFGLNGAHFIDKTAWFYLKDNIYFFVGAVIFSVPVMELIYSKIKVNQRGSFAVGIIKVILYTGAFLLTVSYLITNSYNPFLYFNF